VISVIHSYPIWLPQTQTWMYHLVRALSDENVRTTILCEKRKHAAQFSLPDIVTLSHEHPIRYHLEYAARKFRLFHQLPLICRELVKRRPALLHSHFGNFGWRDMHAVRNTKIPHLVTFYGADCSMLPKKKPVWRSRYKLLFKNCNYVLCEGPYMARTLRSLGCTEQKIKIQPIGVDTKSITFAPRRWDGHCTLKVLIVASFRPKNGIPDALQALSIIGKDIPLSITIIGDAANDKVSKDEKQKIISTVQKCGLTNRIRFTGYLPYEQIKRESYCHHIFLQPSKWAPDGDSEGGAPVTILEMMASGMPVVSSNHCDIPFIMTHKKHGFLALEGDCNSIVQGIRWWIDNLENWEIILTEGYKRILQQFDLSVQALRMTQIYEEFSEE